MRLVLAVTFGLCLQVVLFSLGAKHFDALLAFITVLFLAATTEIALKYIPRGKD